MMTAGVESVELAIQHVRKRRERMPVVGMAVGKGPADSCGGKPRRHQRSFSDIGVVIEVYELVAEGLAEDQPCDCGEQDADPGNHPAVVWNSRPTFWVKWSGPVRTDVGGFFWEDFLLRSSAHSIYVVVTL